MPFWLDVVENDEKGAKDVVERQEMDLTRGKGERWKMKNDSGGALRSQAVQTRDVTWSV